jgi:tetratricopeptide (TPR) repeat protein
MPSVERYRSRLERHVAEGRMGQALGLLALWRESSPGLLEPELLLARVEQLQGHYCKGRDRVLGAVARAQCPAALALDVVNCLRVFVAHDALQVWASAFADRAEVDAEDQARIAAALSSAGLHALALDWVEEAVAKRPSSGVCLVNRALIRSYGGDFEGARVDLARVIDGAEDSATAHWLLARLDRQSAASNHVDRLHRCIESCSRPADSALLHFALFKELDDIGNTDGAWQALMEGCRQARTRKVYDRIDSEQLFASIKSQFPLARSPALANDAEPVPIFIVGMHRSGTTVLERILSAHPRVFGYGESQRLSGALRQAADYGCEMLVDRTLVERAQGIDAERVAKCYFAEGRARIGDASHVTDKLPGNFALVGFIHDAMPRARVIHLRRDPLDLCFANLRELFSDSVSYSYSIEDVAHFHALYVDLMGHWHRSYPGFVLDLDYEELVTNPERASRRVYEFCGLEWNAAVLDPALRSDQVVNTLSAVQVRRPIHAESVGRWKCYASQLEPLRQLLNA